MTAVTKNYLTARFWAEKPSASIAGRRRFKPSPNRHLSNLCVDRLGLSGFLPLLMAAEFRSTGLLAGRRLFAQKLKFMHSEQRCLAHRPVYVSANTPDKRLRFTDLAVAPL